MDHAGSELVADFINRHEQCAISHALSLNTDREIIVVAESQIQIRSSACGIYAVREIGSTARSMRTPLQNGDFRQLKQNIINCR